jgi:hypothetical protein
LRRLDWFLLGGWLLILCYGLGFWTLAALSFLLLSQSV